MTEQPQPSVGQFDDLPEPARSRAVQFFEELISEGRDPTQAFQQARQLAEKWIRERAAGT